MKKRLRKSSYRGKKGIETQTVLKIIIAILAVLLAIAIGILIATKDHVVYTDDGKQFELEGTDNQEKASSGGFNIIIDSVDAPDGTPSAVG